MHAPAPTPMTDSEEAKLHAIVTKLERFIALTRAGPGGVAQLRKIFLDDISELKIELETRPRVRDLQKVAS